MNDETNDAVNSYLRFLPAIYQEDAKSRDFLERFLSVFQSQMEGIGETISNLPTYFDPEACPSEFVPWLAGWLSLDLYELLGDKNREFILRATEFYKKKGTPSGIASLVTFLTGKTCIVKEYNNYVFRSYGMEHEVKFNDLDKTNVYLRRRSDTVDTEKSSLMSNKGMHNDEIHYVSDFSESGKYSPRVIGIFILLSDKEKDFIINEDELHKIIGSFLPVFVRAKITLVVEIEEIYGLKKIGDSYIDELKTLNEEVFREVKDTYEVEDVNWEGFYSYSSRRSGMRTNDPNFRTAYHGMI